MEQDKKIIVKDCFDLIKSTQSDTPILDWLLSKYNEVDDIPIIDPVEINGRYTVNDNVYFCQIFSTKRDNIKKEEIDNIEIQMIKEHKIIIEKALIYNEISGINDDNPSKEPITWLPSFSEIITKIKNLKYIKAHLNLDDILEFKDLRFNLIRFGNDNIGPRIFRFEKEEYYKESYLNPGIRYRLNILSDIGLTVKEVGENQNETQN